MITLVNGCSSPTCLCHNKFRVTLPPYFYHIVNVYVKVLYCLINLYLCRVYVSEDPEYHWFYSLFNILEVVL